jgi:hypothetical protein
MRRAVAAGLALLAVVGPSFAREDGQAPAPDEARQQFDELSRQIRAAPRPASPPSGRAPAAPPSAQV